MALTMTRTRMQTALTKLAQRIAEVHHELGLLDALEREHPVHAHSIDARRATRKADLEALYATIRQFDRDLDPTCIGESDLWLKAHGRRGARTSILRYLKSLESI